MTNREKLSKMALIDLLMYLDVCAECVGFTLDRCRRNDYNCYRCRMEWLGERAEKEEMICDEDDKS